MRHRLTLVLALAGLPLLVLLGSGLETVLGDEFPRSLVKWKPLEAKPVFEAAGDHAWDRKIRERGFILRNDGMYHLWYTGYNEDRSPNRLLGHAISTDGLHWSRDPGNPDF